VIDAFNAGLGADELAANFTFCTDNALQTLILEYPIYKLKLLSYSDFAEKVFNTTRFMQNATNPLYNCTMTAEQLYDFQMGQIEKFGGKDEYKKMAKFNLLANAVRINNIARELRSINGTTHEDNVKEAYFIGKLIRILLVFDAPNLPNTADDLNMDDLDDAMGELDNMLLRQSAPIASDDQVTQLPDGTSVYDFTDGYILPGQ